MVTIKTVAFKCCNTFPRSVLSAGNKGPPLAPECNSLWCYLFLPEFFLQWKMFVTNLPFIESLFFFFFSKLEFESLCSVCVPGTGWV